MNAAERLNAYQAAGSAFRFTSKQRRRAKHKENCRKTHSHRDLPVVDLGGGRRKRVPCSKCHPLRKPRLIGG